MPQSLRGRSLNSPERVSRWAPNFDFEVAQGQGRLKRSSLTNETAMTAKRWVRIRAKKLRLHVDEPTEALDEESLERRMASAESLRGTAWPLRLSQVLQAELRGFGMQYLRKAAESPLRFASVCFPPASPAVVPEAGKQKKIPKDSSQPLIYLKKIGAGEGIRTLDPDLGKVRDVYACARIFEPHPSKSRMFSRMKCDARECPSRNR